MRKPRNAVAVHVNSESSLGNVLPSLIMFTFPRKVSDGDLQECRDIVRERLAADGWPKIGYDEFLMDDGVTVVYIISP